MTLSRNTVQLVFYIKDRSVKTILLDVKSSLRTTRDFNPRQRRVLPPQVSDKRNLYVSTPIRETVPPRYPTRKQSHLNDKLEDFIRLGRTLEILRVSTLRRTDPSQQPFRKTESPQWRSEEPSSVLSGTSKVDVWISIRIYTYFVLVTRNKWSKRLKLLCLVLVYVVQWFNEQCTLLK